MSEDRCRRIAVSQQRHPSWRRQTRGEDSPMENVFATCPICHSTHEYGGELVGRYTFCRGCRARFYVEVPTLAGTKTDQPTVRPEAVKPDITLDDLLWDTQQGTRFIIESLRHQQTNARASRWLVVANLLRGIADRVGIAFLILTRPN